MISRRERQLIPRLAPLVITLIMATTGFGADTADDGGIIKNQDSPHAKLRSVDLRRVRWTDGFWADRFRTCREVTLPRLWELAADSDRGHALDNMKIAAGLAAGTFKGTDWQDAWLYKWIESACYVLTAAPDPGLEKRLDDVIAIIAKAQQPDGYLATQTTVRGRARYRQPGHHELYTMGHLLTAACIHHRVSGKRNLLDVAVRAADHVRERFQGRDPALVDFPRNPSIIMGGVELYRTTGDRRHLDMANFFIDWRGSRYNGRRNPWAPVTDGSDLNQNWRPLRQETEVVGHAVFFTYLYAGAADACMETGDQKLLDALQRLWVDLTERKMYVTGGVSPKHKAHPVRSFKPGELTTIAGDSIHEGIAAPFDLPNASAYNETCGMIGNAMWNWRMLAITGEPRFADIMELSLFNAILAGIEIDGDGWSYTNPLRWHGRDHVLMSHDARTRFDPGPRHICCPTNLARTVAKMHGYLYTTGDGGLWIHHYGGNRANLRLPDGRTLRVTQETDYPWNGAVRVTLDAVSGDGPLTIRLRIPGWAKQAAIRVNGKPFGDRPVRGGRYADVRRVWRGGDAIELDLPMPVRMLVADPRAESIRNHVAIKRGPVVYCLESTDLPEGIDIDDARIPIDATWKTHHEPELLGGVTVVETEAVARRLGASSEGLYRDLAPGEPRTFTLRMIPYYAWNNRGEPKMTVWIPLD
jgi:DUF1680 family protein